jgi:Domain of unknown function (DU1801)
MAAKQKTIPTAVSVESFLRGIDGETKRDDCFEISKIISKQTGFKAVMWGPAIVGFGAYHYKYDSGREGDAPLVAFSPRKSSIVLYMNMEREKLETFLKKFGKHKLSGGCVHIKKLADIDIATFNKMVDVSVKYLRKMYPEGK